MGLEGGGYGSGGSGGTHGAGGEGKGFQNQCAAGENFGDLVLGFCVLH